MKTITLLLMLALILPSVSAAITFSLAPSTQDANPGDTVTVGLWANNDQAIWGTSVKVDFSTITYSSSTSGTAISGSLNGVSQNTPTRITPYAVFAGNTPGIPAGNNKLFDLKFTIPQNTQPGQYQLTLTQPTASDQNGNPVQASYAGPATITLPGQQPEPTPGETELYLSEVYGHIEEIVDIPICVTNTQPGKTLKSLSIKITNDQNIVRPTEVVITQGNGNYEVQPGSTQLTINNLNIQNADCEQGSGAYVAYLHYHLRALGVSPLHFQSASATDQTAQPFSIQALEAEDGQITVGTPQVTKHCTPNLGIIAKDQAVTITYKISNPGEPTTISDNIGGVYNEDLFDDTNFNPTVPPTNLQAGSTLTHSYSGGSGKIEVVQTESPLPFLTGPGTFNIYSIIYDSIGSIPVGTYTFNFNPPPPPALEVSDEFSNDMTAGKVSCQVEVIEQCNEDSDCNDGQACNGQETCDEGDCVPGTPPDCNDDNQCTNDFCQDPGGCQHTQIPNCGGGPGGKSGGGGTSGGGQQTAYVCAQCNNSASPEYDKCCGINQDNADKFCKKPTAYKQFCVLFGQSKPPAIELPAQRTIPVQPEVQTSQDTTERKIEPPKQHLMGKAISQGETQSAKELMPWIIGTLLAVLLVIFATAVMIRRRPEQTEQQELPIPIGIRTEEPEPRQERIKELTREEIESKINKIAPEETPEIKAEPAIMKKPAIDKKPIALKKLAAVKQPEKPKAPAQKIFYKPVTPKPIQEVPLNKYEAEVRKKLAKARKKR